MFGLAIKTAFKASTGFLAGLGLTVWLGIALAASVALNGTLAVKLIRADTKCDGKLAVVAEARKGEIATAVADGKAQALAEVAQRAAQIADQARADERETIAKEAALEVKDEAATIVYRDRVKLLPPVLKGPGAERMANANALIAGDVE